jgi:hypothetical protein
VLRFFLIRLSLNLGQQVFEIVLKSINSILVSQFFPVWGADIDRVEGGSFLGADA